MSNITQVTLAAGRAGAAAERREEREMAAQQKRAAKEKGRRRAALAEAERGALHSLFLTLVTCFAPLVSCGVNLEASW